ERPCPRRDSAPCAALRPRVGAAAKAESPRSCRSPLRCEQVAAAPPWASLFDSRGRHKRPRPAGRPTSARSPAPSVLGPQQRVESGGLIAGERVVEAERDPRAEAARKSVIEPQPQAEHRVVPLEDQVLTRLG